jgi:hypothetical protein
MVNRFAQFKLASSSHLLLAALCLCAFAGCGGGGGGGGGGGTPDPPTGGVIVGDMVVLGYNDLGMHCMNQDFSQLMILPPYNTVHAQVIDRSGEEPRIVDTGITVSYTIPSSTRSSTKTNFWTYAPQLLGMPLAADVGLTGSRLFGNMSPTGNNDWSVVGIPITPITDAGTLDSYQLATITVKLSGRTVAQTRAVVPVSWEISCNLCHNGTEAPVSILQAHDNLHGTNLVSQAPVRCGRCHAQAPLGALGEGTPGLPSLSQAMHSSHSTRMDDVAAVLGGVECYACHPGKTTKCQRDVHFSRGMNCHDCHSTMAAVGSAGRRPWVDEPRCANCHNRPGSTYEQAGTLYRNSRGHNGVHCAACHGSPHAITPTVVAADNVQAIGVQGHAGTIDTCTVCHRRTPDDAFNHTLSGG